MAYPSIPVAEGDILEGRVEATLDGQQIISVFHYIVSATPGGLWDDAVWTALLDDFDAKVSTGLAAGQSEEVINRYSVLQKIRSDRYIAVRVLSAEQSGSIVAPAAPSGVSVVIRRKGILAQRNNFGRVYLAGVPETSIDGSRVEAAYLTLAQTALLQAVTTEVTDGAGRTLSPVIFNPTVGLADVTPIAYAEVDPILRYQRRRELGVGS